MTIGWQNLSSERLRIRNRDFLLDAIRKIHPAAFETPVGEDVAFWVGSEDAPTLVAVAWKADDFSDSWYYSCMNSIALDLGVACTLVHDNGINRVIPGVMPGVYGVVYGAPDTIASAIALGSRFNKDNPATVAKVAEAATNAVVRVRSPNLVKRRVYQDKGVWWVDIETKTHLRTHGPFGSRDTAEKFRS